MVWLVHVCMVWLVHMCMVWLVHVCMVWLVHMFQSVHGMASACVHGMASAYVQQVLEDTQKGCVGFFYLLLGQIGFTTTHQTLHGTHCTCTVHVAHLRGVGVTRPTTCGTLPRG